MAAFPHRVIRAVAEKITASPEFRYGDTRFIACIVARPTNIHSTARIHEDEDEEQEDQPDEPPVVREPDED
jgi:hypothetical protein